MLYISEINLPKKWSLNETNYKFKQYCFKSIDTFFNNLKYNKTYNKRLLQLETYINNTYNNNIHIIDIIKHIIYNFNIQNNGQIFLYDSKVENIDTKLLYKLLIYGNLEVKGCDIFSQILHKSLVVLKGEMLYGN